jgi:hypothetical protein
MLLIPSNNKAANQRLHWRSSAEARLPLGPLSLEPADSINRSVFGARKIDFETVTASEKDHRLIVHTHLRNPTHGEKATHYYSSSISWRSVHSGGIRPLGNFSILRFFRALTITSHFGIIELFDQRRKKPFACSRQKRYREHSKIC